MDLGILDLELRRHSDRSPVHLRRNGRSHRATGLYFSVKSGRHLPHESKLELHDLWHAEVRTEVVSSWPQPFTLRFVLDGETRRYTPDRQDDLSDGRIRIVEIKDDLRGEIDPIDKRKLEVVSELLAQRGMEFSIRRRAEIQAEPQFSAVEAVQRHRRTKITPVEVVQAQHVLAHGPIEFGALQKSFGEGAHAFAIVSALIVRRVVGIDLRRGLHARVPVWLEG